MQCKYVVFPATFYVTYISQLFYITFGTVQEGSATLPYSCRVVCSSCNVSNKVMSKCTLFVTTYPSPGPKKFEGKILFDLTVRTQSVLCYITQQHVTDTLCQSNLNIRMKPQPITAGAGYTLYAIRHYTAYVRPLLTYIWPRNQTYIPLHLLKPGQARFLYGDSDYFWDSVLYIRIMYLNE